MGAGGRCGGGIRHRRRGGPGRGRQRQLLQGPAADGLGVELHPRLEGVLLLAAVDRQDAVRRDGTHRLLELEVVLVLQPLPLRQLLALGGAELARLPQQEAHRRPYVGRLGDQLGEDVLRARQHVVGRVQLLLRVDHGGQHFRQVGHRRVGAPDRRGERLQAALPGHRRQRALLRLVGEVEVFEPLGGVGGQDRLAQLVGEFALPLDALEDRVLAVGQLAELADALLDGADDLLVEAAGALLAVAGDERDGVALVEQLHHAFHLHLADLQVLGDARQVKVRGGGRDHGGNYLVYGSGSTALWPWGTRCRSPAARRTAGSPAR
jgi:hypothetical protein